MDVGQVFALCWGVTVAMQCLFFVIAFSCAFDKVTDLAGAANFIVLAVLTIFLPPSEFTTRQIVLTSLVCVTRLELGAYLLYRVLKRGKDARFDELRSNCLKFFGFWVFQMLWVYLVSAPLIYVNASDVDPPLGPADYVAWAMVTVGFVLQVAADMQKNRFRSDPANAKRVCREGVWRYSRHPNFAGEILLWWGVYLGACPVFMDGAGTHAGFATVVSPLFTMWVLLCLSGIPQAEGKMSKRWYDGGESERDYQQYFDSTPPLWVFPPEVYSRMPLVLKRLLCFECPQQAKGERHSHSHSLSHADPRCSRDLTSGPDPPFFPPLLFAAAPPRRRRPAPAALTMALTCAREAR